MLSPKLEMCDLKGEEEDEEKKKKRKNVANNYYWFQPVVFKECYRDCHNCKNITEKSKIILIFSVCNWHRLFQ